MASKVRREQLDQILKAAKDIMEDDTISRDEFMHAFEDLMKFVAQLRKDTTDARQSLETLTSKNKETLYTLIEQLSSKLNSKIDTFITRSMEEHDKLHDDVHHKLELVRDGRDADEDRITERVLSNIKLPDAKEIILDGPDEIRNKLELLEGDERLSIDAIKDLREELAKLRRNGGTIYVPSGGASGGKIVKSYDLSDSLDGATATFSLPAFYRVISVHLSSFPNVLRPTTDYTTDGQAMTITFTSEINPATSLAAGQTCVIVYAEI